VLATVKKALITPLRQRFDVHVAGAHNLEVQGNIVDHEYEIHEGRKRVAEVSKKWFRVADTYGVDIVAVADDVLILAITVVIDLMVDGGDETEGIPHRWNIDVLPMRDPFYFSSQIIPKNGGADDGVRPRQTWAITACRPDR
jgi:hypothetical protein